MDTKTSPAQAWATEFGDAYHERNVEYDPAKLAEFFNTALRSIAAPRIKSVLELGCGDGRNLAMLDGMLQPDVVAGIEINAVAHNRAMERDWGELAAYFALESPRPGGEDGRRDTDFAEGWRSVGLHIIGRDALLGSTFDLVLTKGALIHLDPATGRPELEELIAATDRYLLVCEYYAPQTEEVPYHDEAGMLWRDDWPGMLMAIEPALELADYGFVYHGDSHYAEDDVTWFLLRRVES